MLDISNLAKNYLAHDQDARDEVYDLIHNDPEKSWEVTLELIEQCQKDEELADVAAGPLEDLLNYHGPDFIDRVLERARKKKKFRRCLTGVWIGGEVGQRINAQLGSEPRL